MVELADRFEVDPKTIQRDIAMLRAVGSLRRRTDPHNQRPTSPLRDPRDCAARTDPRVRLLAKVVAAEFVRNADVPAAKPTLSRMLCRPAARTAFLASARLATGIADEESILWGLVSLRKKKAIPT